MIKFYRLLNKILVYNNKVLHTFIQKIVFNWYKRFVNNNLCFYDCEGTRKNCNNSFIRFCSHLFKRIEHFWELGEYVFNGR